MLDIFYCDHFVLPLPANHRFPMTKYSRLRQAVQEAGLTEDRYIQVPAAATDTQLGYAHTSAYIEKVKTGNLTDKEVRRMGFPWSLGLVERSRRSVGGTIAACRAAWQKGGGVNLAGGTHHAHTDWGQGFCVFNDAVVAARTLQQESQVQQIVILDCDVHQGNGTAAITTHAPTIYTFSIHGEKNFPFHKETSDLDIGLPDDTGDEAYLKALQEGIYTALTQSQADLAIYLAGADPFAGDRLGRLSLSKAGLARRDRIVYETCRQFHIPVATVMAGGYAHDVQDIVDIHLQTVRLAAELLP